MVIVITQASAVIDLSRSIDTFHRSAWNRIWYASCGLGPRGEVELSNLSQTSVALLCGPGMLGLERVPGAGLREERIKPVGGIGLNQAMIPDHVGAIVEVKLLDAFDDIGLAGMGELHAIPSNVDCV